MLVQDANTRANPTYGASPQHSNLLKTHYVKNSVTLWDILHNAPKGPTWRIWQHHSLLWLIQKPKEMDENQVQRDCSTFWKICCYYNQMILFYQCVFILFHNLSTSVLRFLWEGQPNRLSPLCFTKHLMSAFIPKQWLIKENYLFVQPNG